MVVAHPPEIEIITSFRRLSRKDVFFVSESTNCNESFRTELISKLYSMLPSDQLRNVLSVLDATLPDYEISRRPLSIILADGVPPVVQYYLASKSVENLSPNTLRIYGLRLRDFFSVAKKPFQDITANDIRMYLYYYKNNRSASGSYLESIRRILNSFFSWLVRNEYILRNPCATVEHIQFQEHERCPLTSYELEVLRWNCEDLREKAMIDFFFSTGVRLSECHDANISDIDWDQRSMVVRHGKGNKRRVVFFNAEAELSLRKYLDTRTDDNDALFVTLRSPFRRLCNKAIQDVITKVSRRAGLHVHPHKLRHTFATSGLRGGMPLDKLQALMGHAEPKTTLIYAKMDCVDLQREHQRVYA